MGADPSEVALTGSTTDGVNAVITSLDLGEGQEVLTSDEEHPGVWAPLLAARERRGIEVRVVPFADLPGEVRPDTKLVATSHVSWISGRVMDVPALAAAGAPVLLDGAQALGAVPVDVAALGVDFYAASGQKWLCGPNGTGYLFVARERCGLMAPPWPGYPTLESTLTPFETGFHPDARRFDLGFPGEHQLEWALASIDVLLEAGIESVQAAARERAAWLAARLADAGRTVGPRGDSTLVSWEDPDPEAAVGDLRRSGFVLRNLPGTPYVRASVGACVIGEVSGHVCILVDDIVDSGGTLVNAADALLGQGATEVYAYITHGVLSGGAVARITGSRLKELVITNSIQPTREVKDASNIRVLPIAQLIGEAIGRTAHEESVSSLFD